VVRPPCGSRANGCTLRRPRAIARVPSIDPRTHDVASFRLELDAPNNIVLVMVTEDDGSEHDYQFDFDPRSGRWEFSERDLLARDFGDDWADEMEQAIDSTIKKAVSTRKS